MSQITIKNNNISQSSFKLNFNFYTTVLITNYNLIKNIVYQSTDKYISIKNYSYNANTSHVQHDFVGVSSSYLINEIRIYRAAHNLNGLTPVGEMFIEAVSSTTGDITYVCIPLKNKTNDKQNDLDLIIQNMIANTTSNVPTTFNLNKIIPTQDYGVMYQLNPSSSNTPITTPFGSSTTNKVYISLFNNPIQISSGTENSIKTVLGNIMSSQFNGGSNTKYNKIAIGGPNTLDDNNIYIQCDGDNEDGKPQPNTSSYKLNEKDVNQIIITVIVSICIVIMMIVADEYTDKNSKLGLHIYKFIHGTAGIVIIAMFCIVIFSLFMTSIATKQSGIMKYAIILLTLLLTGLYTMNLKITNPNQNQRIIEYLAELLKDKK